MRVSGRARHRDQEQSSRAEGPLAVSRRRYYQRAFCVEAAFLAPAALTSAPHRPMLQVAKVLEKHAPRSSAEEPHALPRHCSARSAPPATPGWNASLSGAATRDQTERAGRRARLFTRQVSSLAASLQPARPWSGLDRLEQVFKLERLLERAVDAEVLLRVPAGPDATIDANSPTSARRCAAPRGTPAFQHGIIRSRTMTSGLDPSSRRSSASRPCSHSSTSSLCPSRQAVIARLMSGSSSTTMIFRGQGLSRSAYVRWTNPCTGEASVTPLGRVQAPRPRVSRSCQLRVRRERDLSHRSGGGVRRSPGATHCK